MYNYKPDKTDIEIVEILRTNGRIKRNDLAEKVNLSVPSVSERLRKLEEEGFIIGYHAKIDAKKFGYQIIAFINVAVDSSKHFGTFISHCKEMDEILECHAITGECTHIIKIQTLNTSTLEKLLAKIQSWSGVINTKTNIVLSSSKEDCSKRILVKHE
jgi:Lrp/AsnC family transcriptional regulator, leucine-responsive regulatory protein